MVAARRKSKVDMDVRLRVDDADLNQLAILTGQRVVHAVVWDDSVISAFDEAALTEAAADIDIYLADGVRLELFAVLCYPALDRDPVGDVGTVSQQLQDFVAAAAWLEDVAVDPEDDLVLVLNEGQNTLFLNAGAWSIDEWEELPA